MEVNKKRLSEIFGVSIRTIQNWQDQGMPVARGGGKGNEVLYDSAAVIEWYSARDAAIENEKLRKEVEQLRVDSEPGKPSDTHSSGLHSEENVVFVLRWLVLVISGGLHHGQYHKGQRWHPKGCVSGCPYRSEPGSLPARRYSGGWLLLVRLWDGER